MNLAGMIGGEGINVRLRQATIVGTPVGGVATLRFADQSAAASTTIGGVRVETGSSSADDIAGVRCLTSATVDNGDSVLVLEQGGTLLVLGKVGGPVTGGGVTDHGALTGLADDDHPQYATDADLTAHAAAADPHTGYQKESEKDAVNGYAGLDAGGLVPDAKIAATIARDSEVTAAVAAHAAAGDPHPTYETSAEAAAKVTAHEGAADPHAGYLKESVVSGLATPAIVLGTAAAAGTGTTPIRHDATIVAFDATAPSTQAHGDAAVVGTAAFAARRDHKHAMPANPVTAHEAAGDPHPTYETSAEAAAKVTAHEAAADPHAGYLKENLGAGWPYTFLSATTFTDPLTGNLKLNNATFASVTRLYIHDNDTLARSHAAFINTWDDSSSGTNRGLITLLADDGDYLILRVSGAVFDQGTWSEVVVAFVDSFGTFANSDAVRVQFDSASDLAAHEAAADPHTGYQKESEKDAASGYAGLDANVRVPVARLGSGTPAAATVLRGDGAWTTHDGTGDPHSQYATDTDLTAHAATAGHTHPDLAAHDTLGLATQAELDSHAAGPHGGGAGHTHDGTGGGTSLVIGGTAEAGASVPVASTAGAIAVGDYANAGTGTQTIAIGSGVSTTAAPRAEQTGAIAIGASDNTSEAGARAQGANSIAIGSGTGGLPGARASGLYTIAVGFGSQATDTGAVGIGGGATATAASVAAVGESATASATGATAVGMGTLASILSSVAIGVRARAETGNGAIAIGGGISTTASPRANAQGAIAIGGSNATGVAGARAAGVGSIAIGSGDAFETGANASNVWSVAMGVSADATGVSGIAIGGFSEATATDTIAIGTSASAVVAQSVVLGTNAHANGGIYSVAIGAGDSSARAAGAGHQGTIAIGAGSPNGAACLGIGSIAIGSGSTTRSGARAADLTSIAIGSTAESASVRSIALGAFALAGDAGIANQAIAIGSGISTTAAPRALGQGGIAIGASNGTAVAGARAAGLSSVAIGSGGDTVAGASASATDSIAIGRNATSVAAQGVAIGAFADTSTGVQSVAIGGGSNSVGQAAQATGTRSIAIGTGEFGASAGARATAANSIAIGSGTASVNGASSTHATSVAIGAGAATTAANQIMLGTSAEKVNIPGTLTYGTFDVASAAWTAYTPTVKFGATTATITNNATAYQRMGRRIVLQILLEVSNLNAGTGNMTVTIPFNVKAPANLLPYGTPIGVGAYVHAGTGSVYPAVVTPNNVGDVVFRSTNAQPSVVFTNAVPYAFVATHEIHATIVYESA